MRRRLTLVLAAALFAAAVPGGEAQPRSVVVIDPGHDLRANTETEPIGPGSSLRKIKDGGGTSGVVSGLREAELNLKVGLRLRSLLERSGVKVVMTRTRTASTSMDRGLQERSDFTGFNWADVPVILVEMGFMTDPTDDRLLATAAYQRRAALGLCRGTLRFVGRSPAACS